MELFLSRRALVGSGEVEGGYEVADRRKTLDLVGVPERMPFILGDDGSYDLRLNQFLRELPTMGAPAEKSWLAYARDLLTWARFLGEERDKTVWEADQADVAAFHHARRLGPAETSVSSSTWDRNIASLDKFYRWATERGHVGRPPFSYRPPRSRAGHGHEGDGLVNLAKERRGRRRSPGFLSVEDYLVFRDVGLRGRLPNGRPDPGWKGRNGERNALFAELVVTTGMRLEEAATVLWTELPPAGPGRSQPLELPPAVTKRGRGRTIRVPNRVLGALASYRRIERANALSRAATRAAEADAEVVGWDRRACYMQRDGHRVRLPYARMTSRQRMASWRVDESGRADPLVVWVAEGGRPVCCRAWEAVFERACERCRALGLAVDVTPHTLRHTFAVHMLSLLIREQLGSLASPQSDTLTAPYRRMVGDPLQRLQRLLGHASIASTYTYLDTVTEAQLLVDDAVDRWAAELGTEVEDSSR